MTLTSIGLPDESTIASDAGLRVNHQYVDLRGVDWSTFDAVWDEEPEILAQMAAGVDPYDAAAETETMFLGVDPGVASTVAALLASGCVTVTSCVGGPGHHEDHPLVVFWCPENLVSLVQAAAEEVSGVTLENATDCLGLVVHAAPGDVAAMRAFSWALARRRTR